MPRTKRVSDKSEEDHFMQRDAAVRFDGIRAWIITSFPNGHYTWSGLGWVHCSDVGWIHSEYSHRFASREAARSHAGAAGLLVIHLDPLPN